MKVLKYIIFLLTVTLLSGCGIYSFSGIAIGPEIKTFEVRPFTNEAAIVIPNLDRELTTALQDYILNQTNLDLTTRNGDIVYEGEIINYYIAPNTATANQTAAENRLTIVARMRYTDTKDSQNDIEKNFNFFFDFAGSNLLTGSQQDEAHQVIIERLTQDMVTETLARW